MIYRFLFHLASSSSNVLSENMLQIFVDNGTKKLSEFGR